MQIPDHRTPLKATRGKGLTIKTLAASLLLLGGLTGCSSSSDSKSSSSTSPSATALEGTAAKGILRYATVEAFSSTDFEAPPLATATTDTNGHYSLNLPSGHNGTVIVRVSHNNNAKMVCDVPAGCNGTAFSAEVDMPDDLTLRSAANVEPSATRVSAHITPLTELVTEAAIKSRSASGLGTLNADALTKGNSAVRTLLGLGEGTDLTKVEPIDITSAAADANNTEAVQLSLLSAAFAQTEKNQSIADKIKEFTDAIKNDTVAQEKLDRLSKAATAALTKSAEINPDSALATQKEDITTAIEKANEAATEGCDESCDINVEDAEATDAEKNQLSTNMKAVKALVEDVRTLGWEVYPTLEKALDPTSDKYVADNLITQIEDAGQMFDADFNQTVDALDRVFTFMQPIMNEAIYGTKANSYNLQVLAKEHFIRRNDWMIRQDYSTWCDDSDYQYADCLTEAQFADLATEYAAQFSNTNITYNKASGLISLKNATYTGAGKITTIPSLELTFTGLTNPQQVTSASAKMTANLSTGSTQLEFIEGSINATLYNAANVNDKASLNNNSIKDARLIAHVKITHTKAEQVRTFSGKFDAQAGTSSKQLELNPNTLLAVAPKSVALTGTFTAPNNTSLEASLTATLDNFEQYSYLAQGAEAPEKATITLVDKDTLRFQIGTGAGALKFDYVLKSEMQNVYVGWNDELGSAYKELEVSSLRIQNCSDNLKNKGWFGWLCSDDEWSKTELSHWDFTSNTYTYPSFDNIFDAASSSLLHSGHNHYFSNFIEDRDLSLPTPNGSVELPSRLSIADLRTQLKNNGDSYTLNTRYRDANIEDTEINHALATITAEVKAVLAPSLPVMDVKLQLQRTAYQAGKADLTLGWTEQNRKFIKLTATGSATEQDSDDLNLRLSISDAAGTELQLRLIDSTAEGTAVGRLLKDGTLYATISKENGTYWVIYHFDDEGKPATNAKGEELASLF